MRQKILAEIVAFATGKVNCSDALPAAQPEGLSFSPSTITAFPTMRSALLWNLLS